MSIICTTLNTHFGSTYVIMRKFIADVHVYKMYFKGICKAKWRYVEQILLITLLRTSLCKNQTTWEMNIFNPPSNFACSWALCTLVAMVTTTACSRPGASFSYKNVAKKIRYGIIWRCLHLMFSTTNVSDKWNVQGFERMLSYEQYPEEKSRLWSSSFKKNWSTFMEDYST